VALNKLDLLSESARAALGPVEEALSARGREVFRVSGATGRGVPALLGALRRHLDAEDAAAAAGDRPGGRVEERS